MAKEQIRVLIVEDHHVVRQGLVALMSVVDGLEVVGEAADGVEAIVQFRKHKPDITLIDLRLPRMGGVDVIQRLRMETPNSRFIVLTTYDGDEDIYRALQAGARAYLLKGMTCDELISTIRAVHEGKSHIPQVIAEKLARRMGTEELTPRELDVLEQIASGKSNKGIATELQISEATVKTHINSLLGKLGVTDRTQAVTVAIQRGIVPFEIAQGAKAMKRNLRGKLVLSTVLPMLLLLLLVPSAQAQKQAWRQATDSELASLLPARAQVEKEHIEVELRTASGIVNRRGRFIAGVVLLTAGYSAEGKYSHYLIFQTPIRIGGIAFKPGEYVLGWDRDPSGDSLNLHFYEAATGTPVGSADAHRISGSARVESLRIWPPTDKALIQIGRFGIPYELGDQ